MLSRKGFEQSVLLFSKMDIYKCPIFKNVATLPNQNFLPQYNKLKLLLKEINDAMSPRGDDKLFSLFVFEKRNKLLLIAALHTMLIQCFAPLFKSGFMEEEREFHYCRLQVTFHYCRLQVKKRLAPPFYFKIFI